MRAEKIENNRIIIEKSGDDKINSYLALINQNCPENIYFKEIKVSDMVLIARDFENNIKTKKKKLL